MENGTGYIQNTVYIRTLLLRDYSELYKPTYVKDQLLHHEMQI
jgi:hypothetical protein